MAAEQQTLFGTVTTIAGAIFGKIFASRGAAELAMFSHVMALVVGTVTLFINWPKIKERFRDIKNKLFK